MYALDTNLLVYAHNTASPFHPQAKAFIEKVMNERDAEGKLSICIPGQVLMEFLTVITRQQLESPLLLHRAGGSRIGFYLTKPSPAHHGGVRREDGPGHYHLPCPHGGWQARLWPA